jgi:hypothetical protein
LSNQSGVTDNSTSTYCVLEIASGTNTWTAPTGITSINLLVVGGGGAGNGHMGGSANYGGGGGGGLVVIANSFSVTGGSSYSISIGSGGAINYPTDSASSGQSTIFGSITALGGGAGGEAVTKTASAGGSSGGSANGGNVVAKSTYSGPGTSYGNAGGAGTLGFGAGGGGGAGSAGGNASMAAAGSGGSGLLIDLDGTGNFVTGSGATTYGAGGGGASSGGTGSAGTGVGAGGGGSNPMAGDGTAGIVIIVYTIAGPAPAQAEPLFPSPAQKSKIDSFTPTSTSSESETAVVVTGNFNEKIVNIQVNGVNLPAGSWTQSSTKIQFTLAKSKSEKILILIFNGAVPVLDLAPITVNQVSIKTASTIANKPITITCSKAGRRDLTRKGLAPICPSGYQKR